MPSRDPIIELSEFEKKVLARWPVENWSAVGSVLAVSGGADSIALLRSMVQICPPEQRENLMIAHVNHRWREPESDQDQQFVENLAQQLGVQCVCLQTEQHPRTEEAARDERYRLLLGFARERGARYVLMAHNRDDQVETMIDRIFRGTGLTGLQGIPRARELDHGIALYRPLLDFSKQQIREYLTELGQDYCQDSSNDDLKYTRNRIRLELLPLLKTAYHGRADEAVLRIQQMACQLQSVVRGLVDPLLESQVTRHRSDLIDEVLVDCAGLSAVVPYLLREMFVAVWKQQGWPRQAMTQQHWQRLVAMATDESAAVMFPGDIRAEKNDEQLTLTRRS